MVNEDTDGIVVSREEAGAAVKVVTVKKVSFKRNTAHCNG